MVENIRTSEGVVDTVGAEGDPEARNGENSVDGANPVGDLAFGDLMRRFI